MTRVHPIQVYVVGAGKLATELLHGLKSTNDLSIVKWADMAESNAKCIVVHAGSGRELDAISHFCSRSESVLIELSTGSVLEERSPDFPVVVCPNTNILMLKFMSMLSRSGSLFKGYQANLTESHQADKTSVPGTAVQMAQSLGMDNNKIVSVRDASTQMDTLGIPAEQLNRHAFHRIELTDGLCSIAMETRVYGEAPYASGVQQIIEAVARRTLEPRIYSINEFIEHAWI